MRFFPSSFRLWHTIPDEGPSIHLHWSHLDSHQPSEVCELKTRKWILLNKLQANSFFIACISRLLRMKESGFIVALDSLQTHS